MSLLTLKIGGVEIPLQAFTVEQTFFPIEGATVLRKLNGAGLKQSNWRKLATTIRGAGWVPPALSSVDWTSPIEISCIQQRMVNSETVNATIPAARRTDVPVPVEAFAVVGGYLVQTEVSVVGNAATATSVSGATAYQFTYYPKFTGYSSGPKEIFDFSIGEAGWSLEVEEQ